jgi:translation initiation factor 2 alpha subunit (eIF-2alpha)
MINIPRFYKKKLPDIDEHVNCIVKQIDENCIFLHILEYNINVLVPFKDLNECRGKKAKYKIAKKYKTNTSHVFYVTNIDKELEISNRGVDEDTIKDFNSKYNNRKFVINILKDFLNNLNLKDEDSFLEYANKTIWKFPENDWYDKMVDIKLNNKNIDIFDLEEKEKEIFIKYVNHSINDIKYILDIEMQMFSVDIEGINVIKEILIHMENICPEIKKDIRLINAPIYKISMENKDLDILKYYLSEHTKIISNIEKDIRIVFSCRHKTITNNLNKNILNF